MRKFFRSSIVCIIVALGCYFGMRNFLLNTQSLDPMLMENVEALTEGDDDLSDDGPINDTECLARNCNWNMASVCTNTGFYDSECTVDGEIQIDKFVIKGSYKKGEKNRIAWAMYDCKDSFGNCCCKQGLYTGETKLA